MKKFYVIIFLIICLLTSLCACNSPTHNNDDNYTKELTFSPIGNGNSYAVSVGSANKLSNIIIPRKYNNKPVTTILENAFKNCEDLISITLPNTITLIEESAFYGCSSLESINLSSALTTIENYAFYNCLSLKSINFPNSLTSIGVESFCNCTSITSLYIPKNIQEIGNKCFYKTSSLNELTYDAINCNDFTYASKVFHTPNSNINVKLTIGNNVRRIPNNCFTFLDGGASSSYALEQRKFNIVNFLEGCEEIGESAFRGFRTCTTLNLPNSLKIIGKKALSQITNITKITIPANITYIGEEAFERCSNVTQIKYLNTVDSWNNINKGAYIFNGLNLNVECSNGVA
ncbi:MAG: leucine-rich repeat domain-containing protein [Clostridia bacterium]|nr:leucine-rich repeat domain-containing protein [Clostridia bacterium]